MNNLLFWNPCLTILEIENHQDPLKYNTLLRKRIKNGGVHANVICLRDYLNTVASLAKVRSENIEIPITSWIYLSKEAFNITNEILTKYVIFYEKFKISRDYREKICKHFIGEYHEGRLNKVPIKGMMSSFDAYDAIMMKKDPALVKKFYEDWGGRGLEMKTDMRWKQILEIKEDKDYYIFILNQFPEAIKIYVENYGPNEEQLQFLKENDLI
jgi:hypothetical protein